MTETKKQSDDAIFRTIAELGPVVGSLAIIAMLFPAIGGFALLGFAGQVREAIEKQGTQGPILYGIGFALCTGFAILPTYALAGVAGFTFGGVLGSSVSLAGIVGGALIGYVVAATVARKRVMHVIEQNEKARVIRSALVDRSFIQRLVAVTLIRLPPNSPFALTNLVMSSVHVNIFAYLTGTAVGIAPRTILACVLGAGVAAANAEISDATKTSGDFKIYLIGASVVIVAIIYVIFSRWSKEALKKYLHDETPDDTMPVDT